MAAGGHMGADGHGKFFDNEARKAFGSMGLPEKALHKEGVASAHRTCCFCFRLPRFYDHCNAVWQHPSGGKVGVAASVAGDGSAPHPRLRRSLRPPLCLRASLSLHSLHVRSPPA